MTDPDGGLTPAQYEILEVIWNSPSGATVSEVWHVIGERRGVTRTTVLNQIDRLERRGWVQRKKHSDGYRYSATQSRESAAQGIVNQFVDSFFGGSAGELVMSLFGSKRIKPADVARLRKILDDQTPKKKPNP